LNEQKRPATHYHRQITVSSWKLNNESRLEITPLKIAEDITAHVLYHIGKLFLEEAN